MEIIYCILAFIIFVLPFSVIFCFQDRTRAFVYTFTSLAFFHITFAFATQALGIFSYGLISSVSIVLTVTFIIFIFTKYPPSFAVTFFELRKINWFLFIALIIVFIQLWSVHYRYTGTVNTIRGQETVQNSSYPYPYFSDEWVAVGLSDYSISKHSLPLVNPLWSDSRFMNPMVVYFSSISELFLLFGADPLHTIVYLSIVFALLICIFTYILLRTFGLGNTVSVLPILFMPYITNGANLPGLWYAMPFLLAYVFLLQVIISIKIKEITLAIVGGMLAVLIYPPMIVFVLPTIVTGFILNYRNYFQSKKKLLVHGSIALSVIFLLCLVIYILKSYSFDFYTQVYNLMFHENLDGGLVSYSIWNVIPKISLLFSVLGIYVLIKKRVLPILVPIIIGFLFWIVYAYVGYVFFIDYPRIVVITSMLLVSISSFGFVLLKEKIFVFFFKKGYRGNYDLYIKISIVILFVLSLYSYTRNEDWKKMTLRIDTVNGYTQRVPASPANKYLHPDDVRLFSDIHQKVFLAPPWKGLVIGIATNNYPLESKASTVANSILKYEYFISADCKNKIDLAIKYNISYVYSAAFTCERFTHIGESSEGLHMYSFLR